MKKDYNKGKSASAEKAKHRGEPEGLIYGRNAVLEAIKADRQIDKLFIMDNNREGSITLIAALAKEKHIPFVTVSKEKLDTMSAGGVHQGVVASVSQCEYVEIDDILQIAESRNEAPFILIADEVEDPHNLGAMIRCAEGCGVHGVIISRRHSATVTPVVAKSSAGAVNHMAIAKVPNIAMAIEELKKKGLWIYGAEAGGGDIYQTDLSGPAAFVMGSEGFGISRLVKEKCDFHISIPMYGKVNSFNVSCATAIILSKAAKDRH